MVTHSPRGSLVITVNCPHLEGWSVLQVFAVPYGKFQSLVMKMLSVLSFLKVTTFREWLRAKTDTKWRQGCQVTSSFSEFVDSSKDLVLLAKEV
jgi:hypothetical protein